jgi:APA family basic amino acid/polyamine antiporter
MSGPRVYYAMAQDGLFLPSVARVSPRFGTPVSAILVQGCISSLLVAIGSFQHVIEYFIFAAVLFLGLAGVGLLRIRRSQDDVATTFRAPLYPLPPLVFLLLIVTLLVLLAGHSPREAGLGTLVVLLGVPVYLGFRRSQSHHDSAHSQLRRTEVA